MSQRIISLQAENVKRIKAVNIRPDGSLVVIGGKNAQGKSSTLDAVEYALHGKSSHPGEPIRRGEKKAVVIVETDKYKVTRRFTPKGTSLVVEDRTTKGVRFSSPQKLLDELVGDFCFDPLAFASMEPKAQADLLKRLVGLDFSKLDAERKAAFEERTGVNREVRNLESKLEGLDLDKGAPEEEVDVGELGAEMQRKIQVNAANASERKAIEEAQAGIETAKQKVLEMERDLEEARAEVKAKENDLEARKIICDGLVDLDIEEVRSRIDEADGTNARVRSNREYRKLTGEIDAARTRAATLSTKIEAVDQTKEKDLASAKFPLKGLGFDGDIVMLNGLPFDQASSAERLKVSVAMGIRLNPDFKVMLIRDGSLLDEDHLTMVASMAEEAGAQVWLERVSEGDEVQVVIEDGMVKE